MMRFHQFEGRFGGYRTFDKQAGGPGGGPHGGPFRTLPERFDGEPGDGFRTLPERFDVEPGDGFRTLPERFDGGNMPRGFGPHGGRPGFHGRPPMEPPSRDFMKARIEEADLDELLMLAGRMARRPEGGPAQGQNLILSILAGRDSLSQRALQQMLGIQPGSLSEILTKLERKGYLCREKAEDRRGNLLRITDAGRQALPDAEKPEADDRFAALTDQQQDQLAALLRALLNDWVERFAPPPRGPGRFGAPRGGHPAPPDQTIKV